ncbi:helix-turn-helix domain-containing protein [Nocardiopsis sp. HNM0947]|uniref:Helix-turn-helix domain-containing protein n=2 Tax=Nocardiopsis coralli TaxID=2772213 RepID=A0ABR9P1N1_9ACTN|nr:helix-turn-helix domain-containing protein [Nocardiopsis coralli]MBE2997745.1 helix-turn-helix domain-containing protein [Nocardiopsis coralli]
MLTAAETAALLGVSTMTVYRLIRRGGLTALRVGSVYRIPERAARAYLREVRSEHEAQRRVPRR